MAKRALTCFFLLLLHLSLFAPSGLMSDNRRILVLWQGGGEHEMAARLERTFNELNCVCKIVGCKEYFSLIDGIAQEFDPDLVISLKVLCPCPSVDATRFLWLSGIDPRLSGLLRLWLNVKAFFQKKKFGYLNYDGFMYTSSSPGALKSFVESSGRTFHGIQWFPSCAATPYDPTVPRRLFFCGFQWDKKRNSDKYRQVFSWLDQKGYLDVYGPPEKWDFIPNSSRGFLAYDGKSLCNAIHDAGIALVLHAQQHIDDGAPTGRIFEAASASAVIISDKHPFIVREFGESVLYIDVNLDAKELFEQIDAHVQWILSHPKEAQKMAQKAHAIFLEKYTLERQVENLFQLQEEILSLKHSNAEG